MEGGSGQTRFVRSKRESLTSTWGSNRPAFEQYGLGFRVPAVPVVFSSTHRIKTHAPLSKQDLDPDPLFWK